jgi:hypothetical protein
LDILRGSSSPSCLTGEFFHFRCASCPGAHGYVLGRLGWVTRRFGLWVELRISPESVHFLGPALESHQIRVAFADWQGGVATEDGANV